MYNAKSLAIVFFSFSLSCQSFWTDRQKFFFCRSLIICYPWSVWPRSDLFHWKILCAYLYVFLDVICDACNLCHAMCFFLFTVTNNHSIHKITKISNLETPNKMEGDTKDLTVQGSKDREFELIGRKISR